MSAAPRFSMVTFGPMIDSELSRFVLDHYALPYREERHMFPLGALLCFLRSGNPRMPLIAGPGVKVTGPRALVDHEDPICDPQRILVPAEQPLRTRVEADWDRFNGELGTFTAQIAYFHLLPHPDIMMEPFTRGVGPLEAQLTSPLYPTLNWLLVKLLKLQPELVSDALVMATRIVDGVDRRIADGRRFLNGDRLTLSDLAFATSLAPFILPDGYTAPIPPYDVMPAALRRIMDGFRARPSAALVGRIYAARRAPAG
ncbi:hypothetical protein [Lichenibacterium dinghuense]|uniref:hypothetical protein n=1 Tax=Lichenibacterium dinghuense TaxID=2895977 RepID=UPI001F3396FB|nr:hypothetical protein [Lichenibacterium sp. 6Y81]